MSANTSRREFLKRATAWSATGAAAPLALNLSAITHAAAQSATPDYKALVCLYMAGGNDAFNTVLATDSDSWTHYTNQRQSRDSSNSIALPAEGVPPMPNASGYGVSRLGGVLPIGHGNRAVHASRQFALHPALTDLQQLCQSGRLAVLANVGPLTRPMSKSDYADPRIAKPAKLYSHNDQQSTWQSFRPEGASYGWAGLMGDVLMSGNAVGRNNAEAELIRKSFTCMTPTSSALWLAGRSVLPFQSGISEVLSLGYSDQIWSNHRLQAAAGAMLGKLNRQGVPTVAPRSVFSADIQKITQRALSASDLLGNSLRPLGMSPWSTSGVRNPYDDPLLTYVSPVTGARGVNLLAIQMQMVARLISTNQSANLGLRRQFFLVNIGGFDTHSLQVSGQAELLARVNHALSYFDTVLGNMPEGDMRAQVTTFTGSDFGRTFTSNGDGTDHGWGGHHFIMGGAVQGGEVYGTFPQYSTANGHGVFSSPDQIQNGILLPTTSLDQYAYTLGRWMGVSDSTLRGMLPNIAEFNSNSHNLGFMRG